MSEESSVPFDLYIALREENAQRAAEIERVHQLLDECYISGDGTEPLIERVGRAINAAYIQGLQQGGSIRNSILKP